MKTSFFVLLSYLIFSNFFLNNDANSILNDLNELKEIDNFRQLIQEIMLKTLQPYKCVVILADDVYSEVFGISFFRRFGVAISYIVILMILSKAMNFKCELYEPKNANIELWGRQLPGGIYTGIIGEMITSRADIAIGDLYYTPYLLDLMDLSVPYNIECLTFLTPEALSDNSWKTLIRPFKPIMWTGVLLSLFVCVLVFHYLAQFHIYITQIIERGKSKSIQNVTHKKSKKVIPLFLYPELIKMDADKKYTLMKEKYNMPKAEGAPEGLYQFSELINSALYTYSMLLLVSLPKVPTGWSLRVLTGWYLLYCLLVVTSYKASMTAILAESTPKVTINTIEELIASKLIYGGWGEINLHFFSSSSDTTLRKIGKNFQLVNDSEVAVNRVADAAFAFYENTYFLKEALIKRQQRYALQAELERNVNTTRNNFTEPIKKDRSLHIMRDCIINMPVSIGLQKNSPIKPRVDKYVRMVLEAGLIKKWLQDSMQKILNEELQNNDEENSKALMNMKKFSGALVALIIGYFVSIFALLGEILFFNYVVKRDPNFNKYSRNILVKNDA